MTTVLLPFICVMLCGAILSALFAFNSKLSSAIGVISSAANSLCVLAIAVAALFFRDDADVFKTIFLIPIPLIGFSGALHSIHYIGTKPKHGVPGFYYAAFNLTLCAMMSCLLLGGGRNDELEKLVFLLLWEIMGLASFVLVYFDFRSRGVDRASWIYLLSCEAGGLLLMYSFTHKGVSALVCGLLGFGLKAGFPILHVWLPKAHPVAPAPVSALMSGAMVNLGIYGLLTFYDLKTAPVGWTLAILGLAGTLTGIMFSLTKRNIKAILAYSTVENCGIITLGIGCGILGGVYRHAGLETFGYLGAFMHLINHASLKGALFLGAGSVYHSTGSLDADKLGGLIRKMPSTGKMFTLSALALSGLPPFNAFLSELVIYVALFAGLTGTNSLPIAIFCSAGIIVLGATGAFALASLVRTAASVFFAEPRDQEIFDAATPEKPLMGRAIFITLIPSLIVMICADSVARIIFNTIDFLFICGEDVQTAAISQIVSILKPVCMINCLLVGLFMLFYGVSTILKRRHRVLRGPTWDCGYVKPTARMQYTSSALVQSITDFFSPIFGIAGRRRGAALASEPGSDIADRMFWNLIFRITARWSEKIHRFQTGYLHFYILVMVVAIIAMLLWAFLPEVLK